jgi:hypothetical protein
MARTRKAKLRRRLRPGKLPPKLTPSGRNPYAVATRRLGHHVKPSVKAYKRKGRGRAGTEDDVET